MIFVCRPVPKAYIMSFSDAKCFLGSELWWAEFFSKFKKNLQQWSFTGADKPCTPANLM